MSRLLLKAYELRDARLRIARKLPVDLDVVDALLGALEDLHEEFEKVDQQTWDVSDLPGFYKDKEENYQGAMVELNEAQEETAKVERERDELKGEIAVLKKTADEWQAMTETWRARAEKAEASLAEGAAPKPKRRRAKKASTT